MVLDKMNDVGALLVEAIGPFAEEAELLIESAIADEHGDGAALLPGLGKLAKNSATILAGLLVGSAVNPLLKVSRGRAPRGKSAVGK
jgi:hypothetical protein